MKINSELMLQMRQDAISIFKAGLKAVEPGEAVKRNVHIDGSRLCLGRQVVDIANINNIYVIGAGKAAGPMASAIEEILGPRLTAGIINVKYGHSVPLKIVKTYEAGHPVPDQNGEKGSAAILEIAHIATENDLVICLISGGGSALLPMPVKGLSLQDKQETSKILLACGASIDEINTIRKHLSSIKGGLLAKAVYPATLVSFLLSDVVGDDPQVIASGPTVSDQSSFADCHRIVEKYHIRGQLPQTVLNRIEAGLNGHAAETPTSEDPIFNKACHFIIASNTSAIEASKIFAQTLNYHTIILSSLIQGETKEIARMHAAIAKETLKSGNPIEGPACILSGGETTVTIKGNGLGGRNQEFVLATALDIRDSNNIVVLSAGTDGTDGPTDAAGALADHTTIARALSIGLNPQKYLDDNDSYHFFESLKDLVITGPTRTNVMDLRIMLIR